MERPCAGPSEAPADSQQQPAHTREGASEGSSLGAATADTEESRDKLPKLQIHEEKKLFCSVVVSRRNKSFSLSHPQNLSQLLFAPLSGVACHPPLCSCGEETFHPVTSL